MCGILGEFVYNNHSLIDRSRFLSLLELSRNRGPDFQGYFTNDNNFQFGFNRLSILDLSENGNQPIHSSSGRYTMVFNGEIYNDIETLVGKTGMKVVYKTYIFHILYILTRLWLKLFKQRPTTVTAPKKNIRKLHYAIAFFVSLESIVLPRNWYGTSIISILATKK